MHGSQIKLFVFPRMFGILTPIETPIRELLRSQSKATRLFHGFFPALTSSGFERHRLAAAVSV